ncbi:MAG TPA: DNA polymerase III subunit alpha, partial [Bdellovibrionales bacterium]|nr:DNA polymerase III subunit alpha [Bdellovibrionales bacterium]
ATAFLIKARKQADKELGLIGKLEYEDYFLTLYEICDFARRQNILHQGRGSAANSIVCYTLGLTSIDPIKMGLLFERFISEERGEPPDIDIDFEHARREEVIQHIYQKYGERRAAMVATVVCYRSRMALREVAKTLGMSLKQIDAMVKFMGREGLSRLVEQEQNFHPKSQDTTSTAKQRASQHPKVLKAPSNVPVFNAEDLGLSRAGFQHLLHLSLELQGFPRHLGIHSGGFVISHEPVIDIVPVESASMNKRFVIQWNKDDVETLKMMKIDVLSLGMLTAVQKCFELLKQHKGIDWNMAQVPQDDEPTYKMIQKADTIGVFQIESRAQMSLLPRLKPNNYYDLVIEVAIVRPGPIQGGMVHPFLKRRAGREKITYAHPKLVPILKKTMGIPLFQEQVMQIAVAVAGFTPGEADELRRVVSSAWKRKAVMEGLRKRVINGMLANEIPQSYAEQIYKTIEGFASYGFPESHAASFALITYISCYFKWNFPDVFACALLNSQPMGFYAPRQIIMDAQRHGVHFLPLDAQLSDYDYTLENDVLDMTPDPSKRRHAVRVGFCSIHGLKEEFAQALVNERKRRGEFADLTDLVKRTRLPKAALIRMASAGAFASFGLDAREALWIVQGLIFDESSLFFGEDASLDSNRQKQDAAMIPIESDWEKVHREYQTKGLSIEHHPLSILRPLLAQTPHRYSNGIDVEKAKHRTRLRIAGLMSLVQRPPTASGVCFISLEDETGIINVIISPELYQECRLTIRQYPLLDVEGELQNVDGVRHVKATRIGALILDFETQKKIDKPISVKLLKEYN